jgi:hypothetical protein
MPVPKTAILALLALSLALAAPAALLAGCGEEEHEGEALVEGEPVEVGGLAYSVQLTRFLNPGDPEDASYLAGEPPAPRGKQYLGVFMVVENHSSEPARVAAEMSVADTHGAHFEPVESRSEHALDLGAQVPGDGVLPLPGTTAAAGPIKGAMVLFLVDGEVTESRPLELEIHGPHNESGHVELDI